jgi:hypothetical protein
MKASKSIKLSFDAAVIFQQKKKVFHHFKKTEAVVFQNVESANFALEFQKRENGFLLVLKNLSFTMFSLYLFPSLSLSLVYVSMS